MMQTQPEITMRLPACSFLTLSLITAPAQAGDVDEVLDATTETTITATKGSETREISTCRDYFELTGKQGWEVPFEVDDGAPIMDFEVNCALNLFAAQLADEGAQKDERFSDVASYSNEFACIASGCDAPPEALGQVAQITSGGFSVNGITFQTGPLHYGNFTGENRPEAMMKLKWRQDGDAVQQSALAVLYEENSVIRPVLVQTTNTLQEKPMFEAF
jgi:hypothetical protein